VEETFTGAIKALGYKESNYDPCAYVLRTEETEAGRKAKLQKRLHRPLLAAGDASEYLEADPIETSDQPPEFEAVKGLVIVEVDDVLDGGDADHKRLIQELTKQFNFGRRASIKKPGGEVFDGQRIEQREDFSIKLSMKDYILQRCHEIGLSPERKTRHHTRQ